MSLALAVLSLEAQPALPVLFALAFLASGLAAIDWPARTSATPRLVPPERLRAAIALGQLTFNAGSVLGPIAAGLLIGSVGLAGAYAADVATFGASLLMLLRIRPIPPIAGSGKAGLEAIREGLRFVRDRRVILSTFAIDLNAMVFGMPTALFPVLALDVFHTGPVGLGLMTAAPAAGAFAAIVFSGGIGRIRRIGRGIVLAVAAWGAAIVGFGLSTFFFPLALAFLAIAGAADVVSAVFRSSVVQMEAPDELRGRVAAIHILVVTSGPRVGDIEAALVASAIGAQLSVISGGLLCLLGVGAVMRLFPELDAHIATDTPAASAPAAAAGGSG
jgi:MFS family permease